MIEEAIAVIGEKIELTKFALDDLRPIYTKNSEIRSFCICIDNARKTCYIRPCFSRILNRLFMNKATVLALVCHDLSAAFAPLAASAKRLTPEEIAISAKLSAWKLSVESRNRAQREAVAKEKRAKLIAQRLRLVETGSFPNNGNAGCR